MRSDKDSEGLKLLNKLKTKPDSAPTPVRIIFAGILIPVEFSGVGSISAFDGEDLHVSGEGFEISFDLRDATFSRTVSADTLRKLGADPVLCGEGTDINLEWGKVTVATITNREAN